MVIINFSDHINMLKELGVNDIDRKHEEEFPRWFEQRVMTLHMRHFIQYK